MSNDSTTSFSMEGGKPVATTEEERGFSQELDTKKAPTAAEAEADIPEDEELDDGAEETPEDGGDEETETAEEDLGEYDPENPEKFDAAYFTKDGNLDISRLSAEYDANAAKGEDKAGLNEETYKFLQDRLGLTKDDIKAIEAGQVALRNQRNEAIYAQAGGKERLDAAIKWGKEGGYTEAQRKRFTDTMNSGDRQAQEDAIEALMGRYDRAHGNGRRVPAGRPRRPSSPERSATQGSPSATAKAGYATRDEWVKDYREARESGDPARLAEVDAKMRRSPVLFQG
ncbi:MAG: hypothetical protein AB1698_01660 [Pseudomonadota bacterium]